MKENLRLIIILIAFFACVALVTGVTEFMWHVLIGVLRTLLNQ